MPKLKRDEREDRATDHVESLDRGLRLLQMFGTTSSPMTLSDLARAADLPRATARRILFTLERGGFVASDGKLFTLTPHVLTLAASYLRSNQVVAVLQPVLDRVATAAQKISSLAVDPASTATHTRVGAMLQVGRVPETLRVWEHIDLFSAYYPNPLPLAETLAIAGLPEGRPGEYLNEGQMENRAAVLRNAYKIARNLIQEVVK